MEMELSDRYAEEGIGKRSYGADIGAYALGEGYFHFMC